MHDIEMRYANAVLQRGDMCSKLWRDWPWGIIKTLSDGEPHRTIEKTTPSPKIGEEFGGQMQATVIAFN